MSLERIQSVNRINSTATESAVGKIGDKGGPSFADALKRVQGNEGTQQSSAAKTLANEALKFSNHAVERMQTRGISFTPQQLERLQKGVDKAASKGSQNSLILLDDSAMIVSVKNNTVVTVMDKAALKENVFTNIDSTVVM